MISITLGTIVYGYAGNAIHIGGITTGNTPIAEIHFQPENELGYVIFTGEIFPTFSEALANHVAHAANVHSTAYEFQIEHDAEYDPYAITVGTPVTNVFSGHSGIVTELYTGEDGKACLTARMDLTGEELGGDCAAFITSADDDSAYLDDTREFASEVEAAATVSIVADTDAALWRPAGWYEGA